jgi:hypothetical protein
VSIGSAVVCPKKRKEAQRQGEDKVTLRISLMYPEVCELGF